MSVLALGALGCAKEGDDGAGGSGGSPSGNGGSGGSDGGGNAGGGTPSSTSTQQGPSSTATQMMGCAQNCAEIQTPPCYEAVCNTSTGICELEALADGAACEDGLFCTANDTCQNAQCMAGPALDCGTIMDPCQNAACDEDADECVGTPKPNGTPCAAMDPCTTNAICQNGVCLGAPKDCSAAPVPNECHVAVCDPNQNGACVPVTGNDGLACTSFGDPCMVQKTCDTGQCVGGVPKDCSAQTNGCNNGVCEPTSGNCIQQPIPPGGMCLEATDACNVGICNMSGQCIGQPTNQGGACNDASSCTVNDVCNNGTCAGVPDPNYTIYFSDTFASNGAGWTLGPEWQIGQAQPSMCSMGLPPGEDPANDHTASADDGIAGVAIGGCYSLAQNHPPACLTSPPINTSAAPGSVFFSYYRHLHCDYPTFMGHTVEVSSNGGATWTQVYAVQSGMPQNDMQWTFASHDVTAFKSANMQVRFCFSIDSNSGAWAGGGWNVDDVIIASSACP